MFRNFRSNQKWKEPIDSCLQSQVAFQNEMMHFREKVASMQESKRILYDEEELRVIKILMRLLLDSFIYWTSLDIDRKKKKL